MKPIEHVIRLLLWLLVVCFRHNIRLRIVMKNGHVYKMNVTKWSLKKDSMGISSFTFTQIPIRGANIYLKVDEIVAIHEL